jgi:hypothetical protein
MKRLLVFLATLMVSGATVTAYGLPNCADMSNVWNWTIYFAPPLVHQIDQMTVSQDNSQNPPTISGAGTATNAGGIAGDNCTFTVTGTETSAGSGSWNVSLHTQTGNCIPTDNFGFSITADGTCIHGNIGQGIQYPIAAYCLVPGTNNGAAGTAGEITPPVSEVWDDVPDDGSTIYKLKLKPPNFTGYQGTNYNWGGHYITETFDNAGADPVRCLPQMIWIPSTAHYFNWYDNNTSPDKVGYDPDDPEAGKAGGEIVGVQRLNHGKDWSTPCGGQATQHMKIGCPGGDVQYESHTLERQVVSDTQIVVKRNGYTAIPSPHFFGWTSAGWASWAHWTAWHYTNGLNH